MIKIPVRQLVGLGLRQHGKIKTACQPAEAVGSGGHAGLDQVRLRRYAGSAGGSLKMLDGGACGLVAGRALGLNQVGGDAAEYGAGNDGFVGETDPAQMRFERVAQRNCIIGRHVARRPNREIDDGIPDHDGCSGRCHSRKAASGGVNLSLSAPATARWVILPS